MPAADKTASQLTAAAVMTPAPRTCSALSSVLEVVLIHRDADRGAVPVVEAGEPVGIVTDRDVALALAEHCDLAAPGVGDILTKGVVSVAPDDSLASVAAKVGDRGLHRLRVAGRRLRHDPARDHLMVRPRPALPRSRERPVRRAAPRESVFHANFAHVRR